MVLAAIPSVMFGVTNSLTISEKGGVSTTNYPIQLGRPFVQGEITNYPQAIVNGTAVATQADVKQRWPDGSVKHAILAFLIPQLGANATVAVTFQNQNLGNNTALTLAQMQSVNFDFGAEMQLTDGITTQTASARNMLNAGSYTSWTSGSIGQTVILADHSVARQFDIGFDSNRAFRPIFHATFWPGINKVRVRFIGEIANSESLEDQTYALSLAVGNANRTQVYSKGSFTQSSNTRWTKEFWIGGAPSPIIINQNLNYLRETKFLPYYDTSITLTSAAITQTCNAWQGASKDIGGPGNWMITMPGGGSRPDIGPYPDWVVNYLYSGNSCMRDAAFGNADLAASWPVHFREGKAGKNILRTDAANAGTGVGRVISLSNRPTFSTNFYPNVGTTAADAITPTGPRTNQGWVYDAAHVPEFGSPLYIITGDFWYLEEMWFVTSMDAATNYASQYERGPTGAEGGLNHTQLRAMAWELRNRVNSAFISPDGSPEKAYFETLINDAIAAEEGVRNITTTSFNGTPIWSFGRRYAALASETSFGPSGTIPPQHQFTIGSANFNQSAYGLDQTVSSKASSLFEMDYMLYVLGRATEMGYPTNALLSWLAPLYTGMLTDPGFNPFMIDNGRVPTVRADGTFFTSFADLKTAYDSSWQTRTYLSTGGSGDGYAAYVNAGVSYITAQPNGLAAWNFMRSHFSQGNAALAALPKWALVPRPSQAVALSCDLNQDGAVNVADVQLMMNQALGTATCAADLNGDGNCNVVDVQRIVNTSLGNACRLGP